MQENKMGIMPVNKLLISMALPMMISMLVQALYNIVDSIFVATLPFVAHLFAPNLLLFGKNYVTCHRAFSLLKIISKIIVKVNDQGLNCHV